MPYTTTPQGQNSDSWPTVQVWCKDQAQCNGAVGMLVMKDQMSGNFQTCSGFLSDQGIFITNDHCIPKQLIAGQSCATQGRIYFPRTNTLSEMVARCTTVRWRSGDANDTNPFVTDTAFLNVDLPPESRPALHFSHAGVAHKETVQVVKVNPRKNPYDYSNAIHGEIESAKCQVVRQNSLVPSLGEANSPLFLLIGKSQNDPCQIVSGNSGSPIISADGSVKGVVHHSNYATKANDLFVNFLDAFFSGQKIPTFPFSLSSDFKCIKGPSESSYVAPIECANLAPVADSAAEKKDKETQLAEFYRIAEGIANEWGQAHFPMFKWKMGAIKTGVIVQEDVLIPIPYCTQPVGLEREEYRKRFFGWSWGYRSNYKAESIQWPTYKMSLGEFTEELKRSFVISRRNEHLFLSFSFSPSSINNSQPSPVVITNDAWLLNAINIKDTLPVCSGGKS